MPRREVRQENKLNTWLLLKALLQEKLYWMSQYKIIWSYFGCMFCFPAAPRWLQPAKSRFNPWCYLSEHGGVTVFPAALKSLWWRVAWKNARLLAESFKEQKNRCKATVFVAAEFANNVITVV